MKDFMFERRGVKTSLLFFIFLVLTTQLISAEQFAYNYLGTATSSSKTKILNITTSNHSDLTDLQGGTTSQHYHLTYGEWTGRGFLYNMTVASAGTYNATYATWAYNMTLGGDSYNYTTPAVSIANATIWTVYNPIWAATYNLTYHNFLSYNQTTPAVSIANATIWTVYNPSWSTTYNLTYHNFLGYNQTTPAVSIANNSIWTIYNTGWLSTYNATYATWAYNMTATKYFYNMTNLYYADNFFINLNTSNAFNFNATRLNDTIDQKIASTTYLASLIINLSGVVDAGNLASIQTLDDGDSYNVSEVGGANPLTIIINYTGVTDFNSLILRIWYSAGTSSHQIAVGFYDYDSNTYEEEYGMITTMSEFENKKIDVLDSADHVNGGNVSLRLRHIQNGITNHDLFIDYAALVDGFSTITNTEHDSLSGRNFQESNHPWAMPKTSNNSLNTGTGNINTTNISIGSLLLFNNGTNDIIRGSGGSYIYFY